MYAKRIANFAGAIATTALLVVIWPSAAQEQGWPINHPTGSSSFPWNSPGYRGYSEPRFVGQPVTLTAPAGQPQKYELNVNALPMMKNVEDPNAITLVAHVPENAQVWFGDKPTTSKGPTRTFYYSKLAPGSKYSYTVRVAWVEDGKVVSQTQNLSFKAGDVQCVYLVQAGSSVAGDKNTVQASLAKLSTEDRKLAEKQGFCAVQNTVRLGAMGAPVKVTVQGQPVFLCCAACQDRAQSNVQKTLETANGLKTKAHDHDHAK
jgi:uncharacterized protein (TIGR03000 family)